METFSHGALNFTWGGAQCPPTINMLRTALRRDHATPFPRSFETPPSLCLSAKADCEVDRLGGVRLAWW
jgi:hypothetical protein